MSQPANAPVIPSPAASLLAPAAPTAESAPGETGEGAVDLGALGGNDFTPYVFERGAGWALLPFFALALVAIHLRKNRPPKPRRTPDA